MSSIDEKLVSINIHNETSNFICDIFISKLNEISVIVTNFIGILRGEKHRDFSVTDPEKLKRISGHSTVHFNFKDLGVVDSSAIFIIRKIMYFIISALQDDVLVIIDEVDEGRRSLLLTIILSIQKQLEIKDLQIDFKK